MPTFFDIVAGVTGTLRNLSDEQNRIIKEEFMIKSLTFIPSVFGDTKLNFDPKNDVLICSPEMHYTTIIDVATDQLRAKRPVLIFFETAEKLKHFFKHDTFR